MLKLKTLLSSAALLSFSSLSYGSMVYSLVDLGALDANSDYSMAAGINNAGTVAGISLNNFAQQVFRYSADTGMQAIPGVNYGSAGALNNSGVIVGQDMAGGFAITADGQRINLDPQNGGRVTSVASINDDGTAVGMSTNSSFATRATKWDTETGAATDLGGLNDATGNPMQFTQANDINNNGQIVGKSSTGWEQHAVVWQGDEIIDLGTADGDSASIANAINDNGVIVGNSGSKAVMWQNDTITTIIDNGFATANDINNLGVVIGNTLGNSGMFGYVWQAETGVSLINDLLVNADGWSIIDMIGINDSNWITANATYTDASSGTMFSHAVLLKPNDVAVAAPTTLTLLLGALGGLALTARHRGAVSTRRETV